MKVITIEELEKLAPGEATIVDVRPEEEFRRGTFEGAINIPMKEFSDRMRFQKINRSGYFVIPESVVWNMWSFSACPAMMQEMWKGGTVRSCAFSWEDLFPKKTS